MSKKDFVVGLDIGTTKVCCIVGEIVDAGPSPIIDIVGIGTAPSVGLRKGVVVNIDATVDAISKAVEEAELMAGVQISTVYAGIAGGHIQSFNSTGIVAIKDKEIRESDVRRVLDAAKAVPISGDREIIHVIPQEYIVDDQDGIRDPIGMSGVRLEAKVHIVSGASPAVQNVVKCANKAGLNVAELCLEPIASSEAVLIDDEKELGVLLIDIGGGTTDLAVYREGALVYTGVLAVGGNHITNDIAVGLRTPQQEAERIKLAYGSAMAALVKPDETIEVPGVGGRKSRVVSRRLLTEIIEPRLEEIFVLIQRELMKVGLHHSLSGGVVISGGTAELPGLVEMAEQVLEVPAKKGHPLGVGGLRDVVHAPRYATGVGLLKFGARGLMKGRFQARENSVVNRVRGSMSSWIKDLF